MSLQTFSVTDPGDSFKTEFIKVADDNNQYEMTTWLFADGAFDTWKGTVESNSAATENEKEFVLDYSTYTLRMKCDVTKITTAAGVLVDSSSNRAGSGCCIRDKTQKGGGYCMFIDSTDTSIETKFLTDANFAVSTASPYEITQTSIQKAYSGITTFYVPDATISYPLPGTPAKPNSWIGYKAQPWPAASWAEKYRFEKGDDAAGYIYNKPATNNAKWIDEIKELQSAFNALAGGSTVVIAATVASLLW